MMQRLSGKVVALSVISLVLLYLGYRIYETRSDAALLREQTLEGAVPTVAIVSPKPVPSTETITLPGNVVGWYEAPMYARVTGYVKMWYRDYGDQVKKGDVLAEINAPDLDAEYQQAKADLDSERARYKLAEVTAKRWVALRPNHAVSEQSITVQEQNLKVQAALVKAAEQKVGNIEAFIRFKTLVAPFDGVVTQRNINVGDLVSKEGNLNTPNAKNNLFTVADVHVMRLFVSVPASFGPFLQPGLTADVTVPQLPNRHFTGKFLTVARGFDVSTRTAVTVFTIDNEDRALWPGSYTKVTLTAPVDRNVLTIPSTALV
ncbi:MAG TPA: efflux RND transporter periplasmic adaptor subunit, partial [Nitrospira sp.]|nr:efflux RND transporter periplasmic adaptor subunit [Nitrospira sp.]